MIEDGYTPLPAGKIAAIVTFLALEIRDALAAPVWPEGITLDRLDAAVLPRYRALFRAVGENWLWFSRLQRSDSELAAIIGHCNVMALAVRQADRDIGLVELDLRSGPVAELSYFGLVPSMVGAGLGKILMQEAIQCAAQAGARRIEVSTCSLDHPGALQFYGKCGFVAQRRAIEVFDDPRAIGLLPRDAAPHIPLIG